MRRLRWAMMAAGWVFLGVSSAEAAEGTLSGVVAFTGPAPAAKNVDRSSDSSCGSQAAPDETVLLSKDHKGLQNVVVRVLDANGTAASAPKPSSPLFVEQDHCFYRPRVQAGVEGQPLMVRNMDPALHNVHAYSGTKGLFNVAQPPGTPGVEKKVPAGVEAVELKCDVHPWMRAWVVYNKNPYFAVTRAAGTFEIPHLPPGKYRLQAWHETLGKRELEVTVVGGKTTPVRFEFQG